MRQIAIVALALCATGCAAQSMGPDDPFAEMFGGVPAARADRIAAGLTDHPLGSAENPVRVNMPAGQRAYLSKLRCGDGRAPTFNRMGSFGLGPYGQILDGYEVQCPGSTPPAATVYLDMYHPTHIETRAPPGFTITP